MGLAWQSFSVRGAIEVASIRSCQKLPLHPTEPMSAGYMMDPTLAKAEPINDSGSASVLI